MPVEDAEEAWNKVKEAYGDRFVKEKEMKPTLGYSGFKLNIRMDNGFITEIQFLDSYLKVVKEEIGHEIYEVYRKLHDIIKAGKAEFIPIENAVIKWSIAEYESARDFVENREAYTNSNARRLAVSSVIEQTLSSALSKNH